MKVHEYVESKKIKYQEIKDNFEFIRRYEKDGGKNEDECLNCGDKLNFKWMPSEPWTSAQLCYNCDCVNFIIRPDCMGGVCEDTVEIYKGK